MGRVCCTHDKKGHLLFFLILKEQDCLVVVGTDGKIILKLAFDEKHGNVYWIHEAESRDKWQNILNVIIMFGVHKLQQVL